MKNLDDLSVEEYFEHLQKESGTSYIDDDGRTVLGDKDRETIENKLEDYIRSLSKEIMAKIHEPETQSSIIKQVNAILEHQAKVLGLGIQYENEIREIGKKAVFDKLFGYGPLQKHIDDPEVSEIMVNGAGIGNIYIEKCGEIVVSDSYFISEEQLKNVINSIVSNVNRQVDESSPIVDARLSDGSRINVTLPPVSLNGPCLTIRKFNHSIDLNTLIKLGTMSKDIALFLKACVMARLNILIFGGTSSGKTTMLNAVSSCIPSDERIVTIEDSAELRLKQKHILSFETRPPNSEGKNEITLRDLIKNSLRVRPDRIIVGEVRSGEALDMLQAMNTGHDGSLTTGHANNRYSIISRLETMVLMSGMDLPIRAIRSQIAEAINIMVEIQRVKINGLIKRRIISISVVNGIDEKGEIIILPIFEYNKNKDEFIFIPDNIIPFLEDKLLDVGYNW
ncbi:CpaF family protein [Acetivibrio cellulolyticus]|uniref:CpaF family protein n=1 Tax=Acetivibrio cellulolyticus TaxID=35830 RepID=UPI0002481AA6|nr:CpaF family protein [Acetivibrio cellulolyticus]